MKKLATLASMALALVALTGAVTVQAQNIVNMQVRSEAFPDGGIIPLKFTSHGQNVQPDFTIIGAPAGTVSYTIILHDIEVAINKNGDDVTHWVAFDIPSNKIEEGKLPAGSVNGTNTMRQAKYFGSGAPLKDRFHHYVFEFYALDAKLGLPEGASRADVMKAMEGHIIGKAAYVGRYANAKP
ncbi:MAG TPA: YbhB/YbcL family Raf kinase inhibitor-like protein [Candidatus Acidoferrum sp.]|nr:YbhB/YbcL family Raf kinase inhibitor-like protein [Candidatus Acidoferrum sp.]